MSLPPYLGGFFGKKSENFQHFKKENMILILPSLQKWEGTKYAGGSWPSVLFALGLQ